MFISLQKELEEARARYKDLETVCNVQTTLRECILEAKQVLGKLGLPLSLLLEELNNESKGNKPKLPQEPSNPSASSEKSIVPPGFQRHCIVSISLPFPRTVFKFRVPSLALTLLNTKEVLFASVPNNKPQVVLREEPTEGASKVVLRRSASGNPDILAISIDMPSGFVRERVWDLITKAARAGQVKSTLLLCSHWETDGIYIDFGNLGDAPKSLIEAKPWQLTTKRPKTEEAFAAMLGGGFRDTTAG